MDLIFRRMVLYLLCVASDAFGDLTLPLPQNQAVLNGTTAVAFNCSANIAWIFINWYVVPVGESVTKQISGGREIIPGYENVYEVSSPGNNINTLTIKAVVESLAGTYSCFQGTLASAQLIVYNSDTVCSSNASSLAFLSPGQGVQMSCTFSYTANSSFVSVKMVWSTSSSGPPSISSKGTLSTAVTTIYQVVSYSSPFPANQCQTSFRVTGINATNVPSYLNTATIPEKIVKYFNPNCSIEGAKSADNVYQGTSISCKADANPPPNFRWSNGTNATSSTISTIQIWNDGQFTCSAWNDFGNCQLRIDLTTYTTTRKTITSSLSTNQSTTTTTNSTNGNPLPVSQQNKSVIIGVVVGIGGALILALLIVLVCYRVRMTKAGAKEQSSAENERELGQPPEMKQAKRSEQEVNENIGAYEMLTDRSTQLPPVYCQLRPTEHENEFPEYDNLDQ